MAAVEVDHLGFKLAAFEIRVVVDPVALVAGSRGTCPDPLVHLGLATDDREVRVPQEQLDGRRLVLVVLDDDLADRVAVDCGPLVQPDDELMVADVGLDPLGVEDPVLTAIILGDKGASRPVGALPNRRCKVNADREDVGPVVR